MKIKGIFILSVIFMICTLTGSSLLAQGIITKVRSLTDDEGPVNIEADHYDIRKNEGLITARGGVVITKGGQTLFAQEAIYNEITGIVEVSGNVRFESGEDILTGEKGYFNLKNLTGKITKGSLFLKDNHYFISGDTMEKVGEDSYLIRNCRLTTCDGSSPAWSITGSEVKVTIEGYGRVKNAVFRVVDIPFIYVPYIIFPAKTKRQTGLLPPRLGYSKRNGADMEFPFFWAFSEGADLTFYERIMSQRGLMQGVELRYVSGEESQGSILFDILSDRIELKDLENPEHAELSPFERTNGTRYWLRSRTDQQLFPGIEARLDTDVVSDQDYLKEFETGLYGYNVRPDLAAQSGRPVEEITSPTRRSALRLSRDKEDYSLQLLASFHQRPEAPVNDSTSQPLATVDYRLLPRFRAGLPIALSLNSDYDYIWRDFGHKGHRFSLTPRLSYPIRFGNYLEFEPSVGFARDVQWLDDNPDNINRQTRDAYNFQTRLSTVLERVFNFEKQHIKKVKHKIVPSISYEYRMNRDGDKFKPWFEPIDERGKINRITLSFDNLLDVRKESDKGNVSYAQWGRLEIRQGYNLDEAGRDHEPWREKEPFEPLVGIMSFNPTSDLSFDAEAHWDHYRKDFSLVDLNMGINIRRSGGKKDSYEVDYYYMREGNKSLNYRFNINLLGGFSIGNSLTRDIEEGRNIEKGYWLEYNSQCWGVRLTAREMDEESSVMLMFRLLGLGDFGGG